MYRAQVPWSMVDVNLSQQGNRCVCVWVCACECRRPRRPEALDPPEAGVMGDCELPDIVGTELGSLEEYRVTFTC